LALDAAISALPPRFSPIHVLPIIVRFAKSIKPSDVGQMLPYELFRCDRLRLVARASKRLEVMIVRDDKISVCRDSAVGEFVVIWVNGHNLEVIRRIRSHKHATTLFRQIECAAELKPSQPSASLSQHLLVFGENVIAYSPLKSPSQPACEDFGQRVSGFGCLDKNVGVNADNHAVSPPPNAFRASVRAWSRLSYNPAPQSCAMPWENSCHAARSSSSCANSCKTATPSSGKR
jgi:hypothetical protein